MFNRKPCVYLVGQEYQIVFNTENFGIAWVEVAGERYLDENNGLMRSETTVHRAHVPTAALDAAKEYTVCFRALPERKPYWPQLGEEERATYAFHPIDWTDGLQLCHIADAHSNVTAPVAMAGTLEKFDLLIMNGDIPAESKTPEDLLSIFDIAGGVTGGERPVLFVRGNHDMRGKYALEMPGFIGTDAGRTYFTFRSGPLWGVALDCGEDKLDTSTEYGGIVSSHAFRQRQTEFLRRVLQNRANEFEAPGVTVRLAVCHVPFMTDLMGGNVIFDIEQETYREWTALLNEMGIDLMLCGHEHRLHSFLPGDDRLRYHANFPVLVASQPVFDRKQPTKDHYTGGYIEITDSEIQADFVDNHGMHEAALRLTRR